MVESSIYRVLMDERWRIEDLYRFPRAYSQVYDFTYVLDSSFGAIRPARVTRAMEDYPWQGGYSYLNFYIVLHHQVPAEDRPEIAAIKYSSPGFIDLFLRPDVALQIAQAVGIYLGLGAAALEAIKRANGTRLAIARQQSAHEAEKAKISAEQMRALRQAEEDIAAITAFQSLEALRARTDDPELPLKLLLAHARRLEELTDLVRDGKVKLPLELPHASDQHVRDHDARTHE